MGNTCKLIINRKPRSKAINLNLKVVFSKYLEDFARGSCLYPELTYQMLWCRKMRLIVIENLPGTAARSNKFQTVIKRH